MNYLTGLAIGIFVGWCAKSLSHKDYNRGYKHGFIEGEVNAIVNKKIIDNA